MIPGSGSKASAVAVDQGGQKRQAEKKRTEISRRGSIKGAALEIKSKRPVEIQDIHQQPLLTMEFRANGHMSEFGYVTPRHLFRYVKSVVSAFAQLAKKGPAEDSEGLLAEPLHARDLRRLHQPLSSRNQPIVLVRLYSILLNFDPLRAIILHDRLILLLPDGADGL
jgi:hypothetical protein